MRPLFDHVTTRAGPLTTEPFGLGSSNVFGFEEVCV